MTKKELKRKFWIKNKSGYLNNKEIIDYLKNNKKLYVVLANGGMGKSYLAEKWSKELKYKIIKAQVAKEKNIKNKIIIDNLDEVPLEKSNEIITWITRKTISKKNIDNIIIFLRPERFYPEDLFTQIYFLNEGNIIPRYKKDFKMEENTYKEFEKYFLETLKINEIEFDFLSILSFKLMSSGKININKYDLMEFIRKYNINNSSSIRISSLEKKEIFKKFDDDNDEIYFTSKTIPSFFVIGFLKKFAHIKYSYLIKFKNFSSQISFKETSQIILTIGDEGKKLAWNLIKNNDFFFMFLKSNVKTKDLDQFLEYGAKLSTKKELTEKLAKIQIISSNDRDFNDSIYFRLNSKILLEKICFDDYIFLIKNGIKNSKNKYKSILMFLNNFKNQCITNKNLYDKKIKFIKNIDIKKLIKENGINEFEPTLYSLDFIKLKELPIIKYSNRIGSVEKAIYFTITCENFEKAFNLIERYFEHKNFSFFTEKINLDKFIEFIIKEKSINKIIKIMSITNFNSKKNDLLIKKIGIEKIIKYIDSLKNNVGYELAKKIKIGNNLYNKIKKSKKMDFLNSIKYEIIIESIFAIKKIEKKEKNLENLNSNIDINLLNLKNDIFSIIENKNLEYIKKYENSQWLFYYNTINKLEIPKNNNLINSITSIFYNKLKTLLDKKKNNIYVLIKIIDFVLQVIIQLDNQFFNENQFHPLIVLVADDVKIREKYNSYELNKNNHEWSKWYNKIEMKDTNKIIIKYLSNYDVLKYIITQEKDELIWEYMKNIIENNKKNISKIINLLDKYGKMDNLKYKFFSEYYNEIPKAKKAIEKMKWVPKNFSEFINNEGKVKAWKLINRNYKNEIKKHILDLFKQKFTILEKPNNFYGFKTIKWYDDFFNYKWDIEDNIIRKTINFLWENDLIEYYYKKLKSFLNDAIKLNKNYVKIIISIFFDWMISISYVENKISCEKERKYISKKYPEFSKFIENIWFEKTGELISPKESIINFNISNYYRYLNDDLTIIEFKNLFIEKILPIIGKMAKKISKNHKSKFESRLQKEISLKLSKKLINEYGILLQWESNTFNIHNKKRIDFILSKIDKYLFIELKKSKDSRLYTNKFEKQLKDYNDSYNLIKIKLLIILENHNPKQKTKENIIKIAEANDFETHFIKII